MQSRGPGAKDQPKNEVAWGIEGDRCYHRRDGRLIHLGRIVHAGEALGGPEVLQMTTQTVSLQLQ